MVTPSCICSRTLVTSFRCTRCAGSSPIWAAMAAVAWSASWISWLDSVPADTFVVEISSWISTGLSLGLWMPDRTCQLAQVRGHQIQVIAVEQRQPGHGLNVLRGWNDTLVCLL